MNLVSFFDQCLNFKKKLKSICKSGHHHLRNTANELGSTSPRIVLNVWYSLSSGLNKITVMLLYMDFRGSYFSSGNQFNIQWLEIQRAPEKIRSHYPCVDRATLVTGSVPYNV